MVLSLRQVRSLTGGLALHCAACVCVCVCLCVCVCVFVRACVCVCVYVCVIWDGSDSCPRSMGMPPPREQLAWRGLNQRGRHPPHAGKGLMQTSMLPVLPGAVYTPPAAPPSITADSSSSSPSPHAPTPAPARPLSDQVGAAACAAAGAPGAAAAGEAAAGAPAAAAARAAAVGAPGVAAAGAAAAGGGPAWPGAAGPAAPGAEAAGAAAGAGAGAPPQACAQGGEQALLEVGRAPSFSPSFEVRPQPCGSAHLPTIYSAGNTTTTNLSASLGCMPTGGLHQGAGMGGSVGTLRCVWVLGKGKGKGGSVGTLRCVWVLGKGKGKGGSVGTLRCVLRVKGEEGVMG